MQLGVRHLPLELGEAPLDLVDQVLDHTLSLTRGGVRPKSEACRWGLSGCAYEVLLVTGGAE